MAESIFPFIDPVETEEVETELPVAWEWAWDFDKKDFKTKDGKMYLVEKNEAIKIWLWKLFQTPRFRTLIYDWDYGHELEDLIGRGFTQGFLTSEIERYVREAVKYNLSDYVPELVNISVDFGQDELKIKFVAITIYGEQEVELVV